MTGPLHETSAPLALVTGASSGIGREVAQQLMRLGFDVVAVAEEPSIENLTWAAGDGVVAHPVRADLATEAGVEHVWQKVIALGRPVEVAALNAGVFVNGRFVDATD